MERQSPRCEPLGPHAIARIHVYGVVKCRFIQHVAWKALYHIHLASHCCDERRRTMSALQDRINELTSRMLQKELYVVLTTPIKPISELLPLLPDHLNYMIDLEKRGMLFASGPFLAGNDLLPGTGMTILRAGSLEEAEAIAGEAPLNKSGMRTFEVRTWQLNEGSFTVTVNYSDRRYHIE